MTTQLTDARAGTITDTIRQVAESEGLGADLVRNEIAAGRLVIPANKLHLKSNLQPAGIGRVLRTKVNANIGTSSVRCSVQAEIEKMQAALAVGADAIMDLSTGGDLDTIRVELLVHCPVPFGTVPIYQMIEGRQVEDITRDLILQTVERQAKQGVDFFTIHAGVLREHLPLIRNRVAGIVSRGGALLAKWMIHHDRQNPLYELFDDLCQEGRLAVVAARETYEPEKGQLMTHVYPKIWGRMRHYLRDKASTIRLPAYRQDRGERSPAVLSLDDRDVRCTERGFSAAESRATLDVLSSMAGLTLAEVNALRGGGSRQMQYLARRKMREAARRVG